MNIQIIEGWNWIAFCFLLVGITVAYAAMRQVASRWILRVHAGSLGEDAPDAETSRGHRGAK